VEIISPGYNVITFEIKLISFGIGNIRFEVLECCFRSPLRNVFISKSNGLSLVSIHGPKGANVSNPFALVNCPSFACKSLAVTSLIHV